MALTQAGVITDPINKQKKTNLDDLRDVSNSVVRSHRNTDTSYYWDVLITGLIQGFPVTAFFYFLEHYAQPLDPAGKRQAIFF